MPDGKRGGRTRSNLKGKGADGIRAEQTTKKYNRARKENQRLRKERDVKAQAQVGGSGRNRGLSRRSSSASFSWEKLTTESKTSKTGTRHESQKL